MNYRERTERARRVLAAAPEYDTSARQLGSKQLELLRCLAEHDTYSPGCGWVWSTDSYTQKVLNSLVNRGLAAVSYVPKQRGTRAFSEPIFRLADPLANIMNGADSDIPA